MDIPEFEVTQSCYPLRRLSHVFYTRRAAKLNTPRPAHPDSRAGGDPPPEAGRPAPVPLPASLELDHVAIAVRSFDEVQGLLEGLTGHAATSPERVESQGVEVCFVGRVELIRPVAPDGGVARFLARRGPGLHHIAYRTADVAGLMRELEAQGYRFTSDGPMTGRGGHRIAFMHPQSTGGVLVELVEHG